jgi:methyl-accepting chemotaxis protein
MFGKGGKKASKDERAQPPAGAEFKEAAFHGSSVAMMVVDRDFKVLFVNEATKQLLRDNAEAFRKLWPSFNADTIVGACIDMFHKNPSHQRQMLADPSRLPYRTDISVGDLKFALNVSAAFDAQRNYIGNVLEWDNVTAARMNSGMLAALHRSQAIIEFTLDGRVVSANENFLRTLGYSMDEIRGQHHSLFCDQDYRQSAEYRAFWERLGRGEFVADKFLRIAKGGREIWIQASYNPILDASGRPFKVVKFATDITDAETLANEQRARIEAIGRSQAVIEFKPDGTILHANENFLGATGYTLGEIVNKHHSMFLDAAQAGGADYRAFWDRLRRGEFVAEKFRRVGKGGREIWIQASYNPLLDLKGRVFKVVKFAADVTAIEHERKASEDERAARAAEQAEVVTSLASGLKQLSEGNLTTRINNAFAKDYEQLRADFNEAMARLQEAMKAIVVNAGGIRSGAGEISQAADDLSRRTEQQAASLEETAAALDEITATVRKTADGAKQANNVVVATRSDAETSGQVVRETVGAMAEIEKSSKQISQIIGVIDEIAFQTNLLALNAGVEAARAGEAGRGFAVVASEVRALAQRSSEAAKEIKGLISASTQHVETGVELVGEAGKALQVIVGKVTEISGLVSEIAASAQEQSTALVQVNTAINQMDQVTQQNAAMVEESTAASHSLTQEADELMQLIGRFQTGATAAAAAPPARGKAPANHGQPIAQQRQRVAQFASTGSAALKSSDGDWQEF